MQYTQRRLQQSNAIFASCDYPEHISFLPIGEQDVCIGLGRLLGISECAIVLGSTYFQRLLQKSTTMQTAMKISVVYKHYLDAAHTADMLLQTMEASSDASTDAASGAASDAVSDAVPHHQILMSIQESSLVSPTPAVKCTEPFPMLLRLQDVQAIHCMCLGIAGQVVDPYYNLPTGTLRLMLGQLYKDPISRQTVCDLQHLILTGLDWRLGPFFDTTKVLQVKNDGI